MDFDSLSNKNLSIRNYDLEQKHLEVLHKMLHAFAMFKVELNAQFKPVDFLFIDGNPPFEKLVAIPLNGSRIRLISTFQGDFFNLTTHWLDAFAAVSLGEAPATSVEQFFPDLGKGLKLSVYSPEKGYLVILLDDISRQFKMESALKTSELKFRGIFNNAPLGIYRSTLEGKFIELNDAAARILGYASADEMMELVDDIEKKLYVNPERRKYIVNNLEYKKIAKYEVLLKKKNGQHVLTNLYITKEIDENGTTFIDGIFEDITERKSIENNLQQHIFELEAIAETSKVFVEVKSIDELFRYLAEVIYKYSGADYLLISRHDQQTETITASIFLGMESFAQKIAWMLGVNLKEINISYKELLDLEMEEFTSRKLVKFEGGIYNLSARKFPLFICKAIEVMMGIHSIYTMGFSWESKLFGGVTLGYKKDHTLKNRYLVETIINQAAVVIQKRITDDALKISEEKYRFITNNIADLVWIYNILEDRFMYISPSVYKYRGMSPEETMELGLYKVYTPKSVEVLKKIVFQILENEKHGVEDEKLVSATELEMIRKDGSTAWVEASGTYLRDSKGKLYGILGVTRDISSRKKTERDLILAKERAEESEKLKSSFLANMSHEIRTPMNGIIGFAELLRRPELTVDQQKKYIDIIWKSSNQLLSIINDVLDISKLEIGQLAIVENDCNLNELIDDLYTFYQENITFKTGHITFLTHKDLDDRECIVSVDETRLRQIFSNLLSNAFKFTTTGAIEFGYRIKGKGMIEFFVQDTGVGIPMEKQRLIFERFRQLDESADKPYTGTGLGLAIAKGMIELMGGQIWVESMPNQGSTFYFSLPYKSAKRKAEKGILISEEKWTGRRILIVEDDDASFYFLKESLDQYEAEIIWAENGEEALKIIRSDTPIDVVLMDIRLPDWHGGELTGEIKKIRKNLPVIIQTAHAIAEERDKCLKSGCDDFLTKPINILYLKVLIDRFFKN